MYVGRFLIVGPDVGAYRVSSRSFPNREATLRDEMVTIRPTADAPLTDNPYVSYNCLRPVDTSDGAAVAFGNGSHVDPIAEKLERGYPARDALAVSLLALDFEKDDYDTPRIAAVMTGDRRGVIGTVRRDGIHVEEVTEPTLVATYERDRPESYPFDAESASRAAERALGLEFEHPVCAVGVTRDADGFSVAVENGD